MQKTRSNAPSADRDTQIVALTVAGRTVPEIAVQLEVSTDTVYRRMRLPHVRAMLADARAAELRPMVNESVAHVRALVARLADARDAADARPADRIRASVALLDWFLDLYQLAEVLPRLAAIEARLAGPDADPPTDTTSPVGPNARGMVADDTEVSH